VAPSGGVTGTARLGEMVQRHGQLQPTAGWGHTAGQELWPSSSAWPLDSCAAAGPHGRHPGRGRWSGQRQPLSVPRGIGSSRSHGTCHPAPGRQRKRSAAGQAGGRHLWASAFGSPGETVASTPVQQAVIRNMAARPDLSLLPTVELHDHHRSLRCLLQAGEGQEGSVTALLAKPWRLSWLAILQGQCGLQASRAGLSGQRQCGGWRWPWMTVVLLTPVLARRRTKTDLYSLSRAGRPGGPLPHQQLKPAEYSTGTFTLSNLGMYWRSDRL